MGGDKARGGAGGGGVQRGGRGGVDRESGEGVAEWVGAGAKYTREQLLELAKSPAALRRPPDVPLQFCRNEPGNLAERSVSERAARRKAEREREKERKEKGPKSGREMKGEGDVMGRGDFGSARPAGGGAGRGALSAEDRHRMMMEEVERERAAFAAARNQQKADDVARRKVAGMPEALDLNRSVFDTHTQPPKAPPGGNENSKGILDMLFEGRPGGGEDGISAGVDDMSLQIPLPAVVPPEASPSKFATSRAGRWFSPANAAPGGEGGGLAFSDAPGAEVPSAVANLWGSPTPAGRPAEAQAQANRMPPSASPMPFPVQQGQPGGPGLGGGMMQPGILASAPQALPGGSAAQTPQSTLSQLLNIKANASSQPPNPAPAQASSEQAKMSLPPPVAPLARPGNSLLSKLLDGGGVAGGQGRPAPPMPPMPMMSAADIERQLLGAAAGGTGQQPNLASGPGQGGPGGGFNAVNFFAQFQGAGGAGQPGQGPPSHLDGPSNTIQRTMPMGRGGAGGPSGAPAMGGGALGMQRMGGGSGRGVMKVPPSGGPPGMGGGGGGGGGGAGFDAGSFFKQFEGIASQNPLPPMPASHTPGAWGAVPGGVPR